MIISLDTGKALDKIQQLLMIKKKIQTRNRRELSDQIKAIYKNPTTTSELMLKRLDDFPLKSGRRQDVHTCHMCSANCTGAVQPGN